MPLIASGAEAGPEKCLVRKPDAVHTGS
jgi:hypothetical protein